MDARVKERRQEWFNGPKDVIEFQRDPQRLIVLDHIHMIIRLQGVAACAHVAHIPGTVNDIFPLKEAVPLID
jgi:hypothetical protein